MAPRPDSSDAQCALYHANSVAKFARPHSFPSRRADTGFP